MVRVQDGDTILKDNLDATIYAFNWDYHLALGVTIVTSSFTIEIVEPRSAHLPSLTGSGGGLGIQDGDRSTKFKVEGGNRGSLYEISNTITMSDGQVRNRKVLLRIENL